MSHEQSAADILASLTPAKLTDTIKAKETHDEDTIPPPAVSEKYYMVIDPSQFGEDELNTVIPEEAIVGRINIPKDFCNLDHGVCSASSNNRHMFSFARDH